MFYMYEKPTLYKNNPALIPIETIKAIYVDRDGWLNHFIEIIKRMGTSEKLIHYILCGPRGMGKTTTLLLLNHYMEKNPDLSLHWISVITPEENPDIITIDDLLKKAISLMLRKFPGHMGQPIKPGDDNYDVHLDHIKEILQEKRRRLCLMVENIDHILDRILKQPDEERKFRKIIDSNSILFIGTSIAVLPEFIRRNDYGFQIEQLPPFKDMDVEAFVDSLISIESKSGSTSFSDKTIIPRIKAISVLSGGVPRYIIYGLNFLREQLLSDLLHTLETVLDEISPLFKHMIEDLPPQEKKVLDALMRQEKPSASGEIAATTGIGEQIVRELLGRIESRGLIKKEKISRQSLFSPLPPLFQIWYEMRILDNLQEKSMARITFLESFYGKERYPDMLYDLEKSINVHLEKGCRENAQEEMHLYRTLLGLRKGMEDLGRRRNFVEKLLELEQYDEALSVAKEIILNGRFEKNLTTQILGHILLGKCLLQAGKNENALNEINTAEELLKRSKNPMLLAEFADLLAGVKKYGESIEYFRKALGLLESHNDRRLKADILNNMGIAYRFIEEDARAVNCFDGAYRLFEKSGKKEWMAKTLHNKMFSLTLLKKYEEAISCGHKSIEIFQEIGNKRGIAFSHHNMGNTFNDWGNYEEAIKCYQKAIDIFQKEELKTALGHTLNNMGNSYHALGKSQEACVTYEKSLSILNETDDTEVKACAHFNMALTLSSLGKYEQAIGYYENALELFREKQDSAAVADILNRMGLDYYHLHRYEEAFNRFLESLKIYQGINKEEWMAEANFNIGRTLDRMEKYERALKHYHEALPFFERKNESNSYYTTLNKIGNCLQSLGKFNEAIGSFKKILEKTGGRHSRNFRAGVLSNLGSSYASLKEYEKSLDFFKKALRIFEQDKDEKWAAKTIMNMVNSLNAMGRYEEALDKSKQAGTIFARLRKKDASVSSDFLETYLRILLPFIPEAKSVIGNKEKVLLQEAFETIKNDRRVAPGPLFKLIYKYMHKALKHQDYEALSFLKKEVQSFQDKKASSVAELFSLAGERLRGNREILKRVDAATSSLIERVIESTGILTPLSRVKKLVQSRDFVSAIDILKQIVEENPHSSEALKLLGISYLKINKEDEAFRELSRAYALNAADEETTLLLFTLRRKRKEFPEALSLFESLMTLRKTRMPQEILTIVELYILNQMYFEALHSAEEGLEVSKNPTERCILNFFLIFIARMTGGKRKISTLLKSLIDNFRLIHPDQKFDYDFTDMLQKMQRILPLEERDLFMSIVQVLQWKMGIDEFAQRYLAEERDGIIEKIGHEVKPFFRDFIKGKIKTLKALESAIPGAGIVEEFLRNLGDNFEEFAAEEKETAFTILTDGISSRSESIRKESLDSLGQISILLPKEGQKKLMKAIFTQLKKEDSASVMNCAANVFRITYPHLDSSLDPWIARNIKEIPSLFEHLKDLNLKETGGKR